MATPTQRLQAAERRARVLRLRLAGVPFEQIAAQLDPPCSTQRAHQLYQAALKQIVREPAEQVLAAEGERLDMLWRAVIARALAGSARHAEVALKVLERRARMLGLDAPQKTRIDAHITVEEAEALDAEIEGLLAAGAWLAEPAADDLDAP
jgi:hypothetical protein